jgi:hypothetical protein
MQRYFSGGLVDIYIFSLKLANHKHIAKDYVDHSSVVDIAWTFIKQLGQT